MEKNQKNELQFVKKCNPNGQNPGISIYKKWDQIEKKWVEIRRKENGEPLTHSYESSGPVF